MKHLLLTLLCAAALFAQDSVSRIVQLKHISPESSFAVLNVLPQGKVRFQVDNNLRVIVLYGPVDLVDAIEASLKKLDVPAPASRNIEVTFQMLLAAPAGDAPPLPADLTGVAQQLRNVFGLKSVRLLETAVIRGREGKPGETTGLMAPPNKAAIPANYSIQYSNLIVSAGDKGPNIRIDKINFAAQLPHFNPGGQIQYHAATIKTEIDVRENMKVVVGKSSIDAASQSIFLVVTAKVVD